MTPPTLTLNGQTVPLGDEANLLELIRRAGIDLPTFCYHSELSLYGACRLCIVDIEGRGIQASCAIRPEAGMVVHTHTAELRETRKMTVELLLANGHQGCVTCRKSPDCRLLDIARRLGVDTVRFRATRDPVPLDRSGPALIRDPNKCVLCGDCVRFCAEKQGVGAIHFAHRGNRSTVTPAFGAGLGDGECVHCGQCAAICPTGAILPRSHAAEAWALLQNPEKTVVAQIAPAVRVAIGEAFGLPAGESTTGRIVAALRALGFDQVYDTAFTADLTVLEEAHEFLARHERGERLPLFTSCCPAWVKFAEQYLPELLPNLSTCRSPQQMFGALARERLPAHLKVPPEALAVIALMPCTAKKFEAARPEFSRDGRPDVDLVLTTQEVVDMIREAGLRFDELEDRPFDLPFGFKTGAGVIFGHSGGVTEAVVRYVQAAASPDQPVRFDMPEWRGEATLREGTLQVGAHTLRLAVVQGLAAAKAVAEQIQKGTCPYDFIEVMACPGGCISGGGQPVADGRTTRRRRAGGLDREAGVMQLQAPQENPFLTRLYADTLGQPGSPTAHRLLHTTYEFRKRSAGRDMPLNPAADPKVRIAVCVGTSCFLKGSQTLLQDLLVWLQREGLETQIDVRATFCHERCDQGPTVQVDDTLHPHCTLESLKALIAARLAVPA